MNLIMFIGDPVSGKSHLANKIKSFLDELGNSAFILKTVSTRFAGKKNISFTEDSINESIKSTRIEKDRSYQALLTLAGNVLEREGTPILDATFHKRYRREWVYRFCKDKKINLLVINIIFTDKNAIAQHISSRQTNPDYKDNFLASLDAYEIMIKQKDPFSEQEINENKLYVIQVNRDKNSLKILGRSNKNAFFAKIVNFLSQSQKSI